MESVEDWKMDQGLRGKRKGKSAYVNNINNVPKIEKNKTCSLKLPKG